MSSRIRTLQKRVQKKMGTFKRRSQFTIVAEDGSYVTLHPTKGWIKVCAKRANLLGV